MRLMLVFVRAYPRQTAVVLVCLLLAGLAEAVGVSSLLPLLGLAASGGGPMAGGAGSRLEHALLGGVRAVGLEPSIGLLTAMIVAGVTIKAALVMLADKHVGYTVARIATDLRLSLIRALLRTRWEYYVHQPLGSFANAVAAEARQASEAYLRAATILAMLVEAGAYVAVACLVSGQATLAALAGGVIIVAALNGLVRTARRAGARQTRLAKVLVGRLTDVLQSVKPLKAMGREPFVGPLLEHETFRLNRAVEREVLSKAAMRALQEPLIIAFLGVGLYFALTWLALPLAAVIMMALLCASIISGLGKAQKEFQRMAACESSFWSLRAMIDHAEAACEASVGEGTPTLRSEIALRDVTFAYAEEPVLQQASLVIVAGQLTTIVGPSGSGKTTVADLITGLIEPQQGSVLVDGVSLREVDMRQWRSRIGYVPQETVLLHESVRINVTLGDPDLTAADVEAALRQAGAWDFVAALPEGMEAVVGERGLGISGGQRQRVALARALVRRPSLLILDEATAALDPATEAGICQVLQTLRDAVTILAICHQGPLIDAADRVYRVGGGRITEVAPRDPAAAAATG